MKKILLYVFVLGMVLLYTQEAVSQPSIPVVYLEASSPDYSTNDNLRAVYTPESAVETAVAWSINGEPFSLLYLPFEAGATTALQDFSGSNHDVTAVGNPVWSASAGHNGTGAFTFDGTNYLDAGAILPLNSSYTKSAWIYITYEVGYRNIMSASVNVPNNHSLRVDENGRLNAGHNAGLYNVTDTDSLVNNQWYFVAVTFNYQSGEMILYKDGVEVDRDIVPEELRSVTDPNVFIGAKAYGFNFFGNIDDARLYGRALSPTQIGSLYEFGEERILYRETHGGETWQVCATPFSASEVGDEVCSSSYTLQAATVSNVVLTSASTLNLVDDDLTASFSSNTSAVATATAWYRNGTPDALLYLPFEGGKDGALLDYSGSGNDVSYPEELDRVPSWNSVAHNGSGAFSFDGSDYLVAGDIFPQNSSYTKTAWIYNTLEGFRNIISSTQLAQNNHFLKLNPDRRLNAGHNMGEYLVIDPAACNLDTWYFVAVTFDFATGEMILYKNGVQVDQAIVPDSLRSIASPGVLIGAMNNNYEWVGVIDEPRIYDRVVTPEQILAMYTSNNVMVSEETSGGDEWYAEVTPFSKSEAGTTLVSNTLYITSVIVDNIPDQTIQEGGSFTDVDLDDFVTVYEFTNDDLVWTTTGNTDIGVDIDPTTHVATFTLPSAEWYGSENITFVATNPNGVEGSDMAVFTVENINDPPVLTEIGDQTTPEDVTLQLTVTFSDPDVTDTHTISVTTPETNVDVLNQSGNVSGSTYDLVPAAGWFGTAEITVTVTENNAGGLSDSETYVLTVTSVNDAPVLTKIGNQTTDEDVPLTGLVVAFSDQDAGDTHTITVASSEIQVTANLSGQTSGSTYDLVPDPNWFGSTQITVTVTDNGTGALSDSEVYTLDVLSVNDVPSAISLSPDSIDEGVAIGTVVGTLTSADPDSTDVHTYEFVYDGGQEETDNPYFLIEGNELKTNAELNYEAQNTFSLLIKSDDGQGGSLVQQVSVKVNDVFETSIGDGNETLSFRIYPVPVSDILTVEIDNPENQELLLEIFTYAGKLVHSEETFTGNTIDVSEFTEGMYFLKIKGENIYTTRKIIVQDR